MNWDSRTIREAEIASIREFVERQRGYLAGRVLDFGAGKPGTCREPQPYRDLVSGEYVSYDLGDHWPTGDFDAVLCTQVIEYLPDPAEVLSWFRRWLLVRCGYLVITGPINWAEVETTDLQRFTRAGIRRVLESAGFSIMLIEGRTEINLGGFRLCLGYGVLARAGVTT